MAEDNNSSQQVCRHNQTGYCRYRSQCHHEHVNEICEVRICRENSCRKRNPKTCKYFVQNNTYKYDKDCAFSHPENKSSNALDTVKKEVNILKAEVEELKKCNSEVAKVLIKIQSEEIKDLNQKVVLLNYNMSEMMVKIAKIEVKEKCEWNPELQPNQITQTEIEKEYFKCEVCSNIFNSKTF